MKRTSKRVRIKRKRLPRSDWDFSAIKDEDADWLCLREYSRECLRAWDDGRLEGSITIPQTLRPGSNEWSPSIKRAVREGIEARVQGKRPSQQKGRPTVEEIDGHYDPRSAVDPVGTYVVRLRIDWRAGNREIKRALEDWLEDHVRSKKPREAARDAYLSNMLNIVEVQEDEHLRDYEEMAANYFMFLQLVGQRADTYPTDFVIKQLRRGVGVRRGRGDTKRTQLLDLAVARLHWSGKSGAEIKQLLGKSHLKTTEPEHIEAATRRVLGRLASMIYAAEMIETARMTRANPAIRKS